MKAQYNLNKISASVLGKIYLYIYLGIGSMNLNENNLRKRDSKETTISIIPMRKKICVCMWNEIFLWNEIFSTIQVNKSCYTHQGFQMQILEPRWNTTSHAAVISHFLPSISWEARSIQESTRGSHPQPFTVNKEIRMRIIKKVGFGPKYSWDAWASWVALVIKNLPANAGDVRDTGSIPGLGRSP